jgi:hypothetical protein
LLDVDTPDADANSEPTSLEAAVVTNFAVGFDSERVEDAVTFQRPNALQLTFARGHDHDLTMRAEVGPFVLNEPATWAHAVILLPVNAEVIQCDGVNLFANAGGEAVVPVRAIGCEVEQNDRGVLVHMPLSPDTLTPAEGDVLSLVMSANWKDPSVTRLGVGRERITLKYWGKFFPNTDQDVISADALDLEWDDAASTGPGVNRPGVHLLYEIKDSNTVFTDVAPEADGASGRSRIWVSDSDNPTVEISIETEDRRSRRQLDLISQLVFLIVGAVIGATVPTVWSRLGKIRHNRASTAYPASG